MSSIKTIILDNDANSRFAACRAFERYEDLSIEGAFGNIEELFEYLEENTVHLAFLDIELDGESGFDAAKRLGEEYPDIMVVFLTGHSSYAINGYDFYPVNFLTKPINHDKLKQTVEEVKRRIGRNGSQSSAKLMFHLRQGGYRIIDVRDICYVERNNRKNYLCTENERIHIANHTMKELEEMLSKHGFFLSHQSFILSLYRVTSVRDVGRQLYEATLRGTDTAIPVSRHRYEELLRQLSTIDVNVAFPAK